MATGLHPSPFGHTDVVMTTTHKMLRGPRGALIFSKNEEIATKINKMIFPGMQGGPHMHTISAIAQCLFEAQSSSYKKYCAEIIINASAMVDVFRQRDFAVVTGGTDNHLWLLDLRSKGLTGAEAQEKLEAANIVANKNAIPYDPAGPFKPSGIRMGTPAITTRGFSGQDSLALAEIICDILEGKKYNKTQLNQLIASRPMPTV